LHALLADCLELVLGLSNVNEVAIGEINVHTMQVLPLVTARHYFQ